MSANTSGPTWRVQSVWEQHFDEALLVVSKGRRVASERTKIMAAASGVLLLLLLIGLGYLLEFVAPGLLIMVFCERIFGVFWPRRWVAQGESVSAVFACGTWSSRAGGLIASTSDGLVWDDEVVLVDTEGVKLDAEQRTRLQHDLERFK